MFTGLVEEVGKISKIEKTSTGEYLIQVKCSLISPQKLSIGESVAVRRLLAGVT
jgi:riboflavin synthase alpha subunit